MVSSLHVHENDEIYIKNLRHTMFNVHKVTFRYIRIIQNFTNQQSIISFNIDKISQDVRNELPWELLYADDLAIIDVTSTDTQNRLESWQKVF